MKTCKFNITGMTCAACQANVTKAAKKLDGTEKADVNLLSNSMTVTFDENKLTEQDFIDAINNIGYGASLYGSDNKKSQLKTEWQERKKSEEENISSMKKRLISSIIFLVIVMYIAMGHMIGLPLPHFLHGTENALLNAIVQMLLVIPVMIINKKFFLSGFKGLLKRAANMDSLVALGSSASFIYGVFAVIMMAYAAPRGNLDVLEHYAHELYFESSAMILTLVTVGKFLETRSKGKTSDALGKLVELSPKTANVIRNGKEITIDAEDVKEGDTLIIRPGERIAVDGIVLSGNGFIDQSAVTGESLPIEKSVDDEVISATLNKNGTFTMTASRVGENTTLAQIINLVDEAGSSKAPIARLADKVSGIFVPAVMIISAITFLVWLLVGKDFETALSFAVTVLVISCPCALGLATPVAIMAGTGKAAENGILIKSAEALEALGNVDKIVVDKTGTVTSGEMSVSDIFIYNKALTENEFLAICTALEKGSEHPLANAVRKKGENLSLPEVKEFKVFEGKGISGVINGEKYISGNVRFLKENNIDYSDIESKINEFSSQGKTPLIFCKENEIIGIIAISDTIREDSIEAIEIFKKLGKKVVMLTGDNKAAAEFIGKNAGIDEIYSELLPADKEKTIRSLQEKGEKIAFIGDGINDAPALTRADVGIAIGAGTDIAIDAADIVLIKSSLSDGAKAVELSKAVMRNIKMNLFWAFFYNVLGIPLAAGALYPAFALKLTPMIGSAAMSMSSLCVVTNALRLRFFKSKYIKEENNKKSVSEDFPETEEKGNNIMEKVIKVEGMMCPRCEAHVVKALTAVDGVESATASHEENIAKVALTKDVADDVLIKAIVDEGYEASF